MPQSIDPCSAAINSRHLQQQIGSWASLLHALAKMNKNPIPSIFRKEILNISAYKIVESKNFIKLDEMENPYSWPENIKTQRITKVTRNK